MPRADNLHLNVPPISDPKWRIDSEPLQFFLSKWRTWPEIERWAKESKVNPSKLRHMLAFLEDRKLAISKMDPKTEEWRWAGFNVKEDWDRIEPILSRLSALGDVFRRA
jgi:hypothetical protein